jgi:hypothetical protein
MQPTKVLLSCAFAALAACSSHSKNGGGTDGGSNGGDAPLPACDYTEKSDATNDTTTENTGLTIGATTRTVCGNVDTGHYDSSTMTADIDSYTVAVAAAKAELVIDFENQTPASLTDFTVEIFDTNTPATLLYAGDYTGALAVHGAYIAELPAGSFDVVVTATAAAAIATAIPYTVRLVADNPTVRCPDLTGMQANYTEAHDGATNTGNDVVLINFSQDPSFTMTPYTSAPEATQLTINPDENSHVVGSSAMVAAGTDKYLDRDTFAITTGASTNELSVRLNWPGATADLDYVVFPASSIMTPVEAATLTSTSEDEFATLAVKPNTSYWLWIGAYTGSTGLPIAYSATVCGGEFTP